MDIQNNNLNEAGKSICWSCKASIDIEDNFCRRCGKGRGKFTPWYYTYWGAVILIFAIGPFSLYFIWKSPLIAHGAKWAYTAIISIITWYVALAVYHMWIFIQEFMAPALMYQ